MIPRLVPEIEGGYPERDGEGGGEEEEGEGLVLQYSSSWMMSCTLAHGPLSTNCTQALHNSIGV